MGEHSHIHWQAPCLILGFLAAGVLFSVGHHEFYLSLDGNVVSDHDFNLFGSRHSRQQINLAIGTAFSFLVRACFALSVSTAYYQIFWRILRSKRVKLGRIDDAFSATENFFALFNVPLWIRQPLLFLAASTAWLLPIPSVITPGTLSVNLVSHPESKLQYVPQLDFSSLAFLSNMPDVGDVPYSDGSIIQDYQYKGPSASLKQTAMDVAIQDQILPIHPPSSNSSWSLDFHAPSLRCRDVSATNRRLIEENIKQFVKQQGCDQEVPITYLSWYPHYDALSETVYTAPFTNFTGLNLDDPNFFCAPNCTINFDTPDAIFDLGSSGTRSMPMPPLYVAALPGILDRTFYSYVIGKECNYNMSDSTISAGSPLGGAGENATILQCEMSNSTYRTAFNYVNGQQSIRIDTVEAHSYSNVNLLSLVTAKINSSCNALELTFEQPPCIFNSSILRTLSYQAMFQSFSEVLTGTIIDQTNWGYGIIDNTNVRNTFLMNTKELGYLRDNELQDTKYTDYFSDGLQSALANSSTPWIKYASGTSSVRNQRPDRMLKDAIEEMFHKFVISSMTHATLQPDFSAANAPPKINVTSHTFKTIYVYSEKRLWIAYGIATALTLVIAGLGLLAILSNRASYDDSFSTVVRTSRYAELSTDIRLEDGHGKSPLPQYLKTATFGMPPQRLGKTKKVESSPLNEDLSRTLLAQRRSSIPNGLRKSSVTW